ncbi:MAG: flap endonuclease [Myxococcales bacterium]|nr:flap endonuclease [Myxococcales bacterium]
MFVHLVDGTYELFRQFFGAPDAKAPDGREVGATRALLRTLISLLREETTTHIACAYDTQIESFRNAMFDGYKTGEGMEPLLWAQFPLAERATRALGITCWSMIEFEADDGLATGAARYGQSPEVERIFLCSPDKDLMQCVRGDRIVMLDRRRNKIIDEDGVREKLGISPGSVPDYLGLVGDSADGIPGIPRWGAKSAAAVLSVYEHIDNIPDDHTRWTVKVRGAEALAQNLAERRDDAALYRQLAVLRTDVPHAESLDDLRWRGAKRDELEALCAELGEDRIIERVPLWQ